MNPNWGVEDGLDKGVGEVDGCGGPIHYEAQYEEKSDGTPSHNRSIIVFIIIFFKVAADAVAGFELSNVSAW